MPPRTPGVWMWDEACEMIDRAERLNRQFFVPSPAQARRPAWEPPLDILETEEALWIVAALPGVAAEHLEVVVDSGILIVRGERRLKRVPRVSNVRQSRECMGVGRNGVENIMVGGLVKCLLD